MQKITLDYVKKFQVPILLLMILTFAVLSKQFRCFGRLSMVQTQLDTKLQEIQRLCRLFNIALK